MAGHSVALFNWLVALALLTTSIANIYILSEPFGLYLAVYPIIMLTLPFLPGYLRLLRRDVVWFDMLAIAFIVATAVSAVLSPNSKSITYVALYGFSTIFLGIALRIAISGYGLRNFLNAANALAVAMVAMLGSVEFWIRYSYGLNPFASLRLATPPLAICGLEMPRSYALSLEPTYLGWYLMSLGLLALWHVWQNTNLPRLVKLLFAILLCFASLVTWSSSTFICFIAAAIGVGFYVTLFDRKRARDMVRGSLDFLINAGVVAVAVAGVILISVPYDKLAPCLGEVSMKPVVQATGSVEDTLTLILRQQESLQIMLSDAVANGNDEAASRIKAAQDATENSLRLLTAVTTIDAAKGPPKSSMSRFAIWKQDLSLALDRPIFGWGPGYNSTAGDTSSLNILIFVFFENGGIAAVLLAGFFVSLGLDIARSNVPSRYVFLLAYSFAFLHLLTQTKHFHPVLWLVIALFWLERSHQRRVSSPFETHDHS